MNSMDLLRAFGDIDEQFLNEMEESNIEKKQYSGRPKIAAIEQFTMRKGVVVMKENKMIKSLIVAMLIIILASGVVLAGVKIYENIKGKATITPTYTSKISSIDTNKVWIGTFNLVWNDFMNDVIGGKVEFIDGNTELLAELNKQTFKANQLSDKSYFKTHGNSSLELKNKIENSIKQKFNEESKIVDKVNWNDPNGYVLYAMLKKEFNYLEKFPVLTDKPFANSKENVKYFGIAQTSSREASKNVEILFYNSENDFAIKLKTKEGEEVILYKTDGENKSFEENYNTLKNNAKSYKGEKTLQEDDIIEIPYIRVNDEINYDELCGKIIKGTNNMYIRQALQTVDFELNNVGGTVKSEALVETTRKGFAVGGKKLLFNSDFILYLKEESKEQPYFALKVDNTDVLVNAETK